MIDLHCHLLVGLDDGPASSEASVAMARACVAAGVEIVAATPHVNARFANDAATIAREVAATGAILSAAGVPLQLATGAEIDLFQSLETDDRVLRSLGLGGGPWLLIESPHQLHPRVEASVNELLLRGHRVLLAHPERSPAFLRDAAMLRRLVEAGARAQVTAGSLTGRFGKTIRAQAHAMLMSGLIQVVASDAHNLQTRTPDMRTGLQAAGLAELHRWLTEEVPRLILAGAEVPQSIPLARARRPRRFALPLRAKQLAAKARGAKTRGANTQEAG
jgi:protein-tyrosine phosphatase